MLRLAGFAIAITLVLSLLLAYAATFSSPPIVSQELVIPIEEVTTIATGGPGDTTTLAEPPGESASLAGTIGAPACTAGTSDGLQGDCGDAAAPSEVEAPAAAAAPTPEPEPEIEAPDRAPIPYDPNPQPFFSLDAPLP